MQPISPWHYYIIFDYCRISLKTFLVWGSLSSAELNNCTFFYLSFNGTVLCLNLLEGRGLSVWCLFPPHVCVGSGFLPQSKNIHVMLISNSKSVKGVNLNGYLSSVLVPQ